MTPNEVVALRRLAREEHAATAFADLEQRATLPGRLFALCGLYYADREVFLARVAPYRASEATVFFQTGCSGLPDQTVAELVEREGPGTVRLSGDQTVKQWAAENRERLEQLGGYRHDLVGGGWPNLLLRGGGWHAAQDEEYAPEKG